MSAVSEAIVREYFEHHGFLVRQGRKFIAPNQGDDDEIDFVVLNPKPAPGEFPFELSSADLPKLARAMVVVKSWHTDTFSAGLLANAPEIFRFLEPAVLGQITQSFGADGPVAKVLVVPALPKEVEARRQSIRLLKEKGIDAVLTFRTLIADLLASVETNRNYQKSDLLQTLRVLKNYDFIREPQLDLFPAPPVRRLRTRKKG